jgi:hypothetical protein
LIQSDLSAIAPGRAEGKNKEASFHGSGDILGTRSPLENSDEHEAYKMAILD